MSKRVIRLSSSSFVNTPGLLRWAINGYKFKRDRKYLLKVFVDGYTGPGAPSPETFDRLLKGLIPYTVEDGPHGGTVVFEEAKDDQQPASL
jgi:hypothetical protein